MNASKESISCTRRQFLAASGTALALAAGASADDVIRGEENAGETSAAVGQERSPIGCFNRAWSQWSSDTAFAAIAAAGFQLVGLISNHDDNPGTLPTAAATTLAALKESLAANRLTVNMTALRYPEDAPDDECEAAVLAQLDHAQALGVQYVMTFGADRPPNFPRYWRLMAKVATWAAERNQQLVLKPHGGVSASAKDLQHCLDAVAHDNFKIWYDAGNILHYTGNDPIEELKPIAKYVTGLCAKDCSGQGGDVMIQFGAGDVNFKGVLAVLHEAGFHGPIMVEGLKVGATPEETADFARANREFLEAVLRTL